jgi:hypothetical protein
MATESELEAKANDQFLPDAPGERDRLWVGDMLFFDIARNYEAEDDAKSGEP